MNRSVLLGFAIALLFGNTAESGETERKEAEYSIVPAEIQKEIDKDRPVPTEKEVAETKARKILERHSLSQSDSDALRTVLEKSGASNISFSKASKKISRISEPSSLCVSSEEIHLLGKLLPGYDSALKGLLRFSSRDELVYHNPSSEQKGETPVSPFGFVEFRRVFDGIPVVGNYIRVYFSDEKSDQGCLDIKEVVIRWEDVKQSDDWSGVVEADSVLKEIEIKGRSIESLDLVYVSLEPSKPALLVYKTESFDNDDLLITYFDAYTSDILAEFNTTRQSAYGTVKIPVNLPFEPIDPVNNPKSCLLNPNNNCHPMPYVYVADSAGTEVIASYNINGPDTNYIKSVESLDWTNVEHPTLSTTDYLSTIGQTNYNGYFWASNAAVTNNDIFIDNNKSYYYHHTNGRQDYDEAGVYAVDRTNFESGEKTGVPVGETASDDHLCRRGESGAWIGPYSRCSSSKFVQGAYFSSNGSTVYMEDPFSPDWYYPNYLGIRMEIQFFLTYGQQFFRNQMAISTFQTVPYAYYWIAEDSSNGGYATGTGCAGITTYRLMKVGCLNRFLNESPQHTAAYQQWFRSTIFHEYGHTVDHNNRNSATTWPDAGYWGWEHLFAESISQITEVVLGKFEHVDFGISRYGADRKWPTQGIDDVDSPYTRATSLVSIYLDMLMSLGYNASKIIYRIRSLSTNETVMVGDCQDGGNPGASSWRYCPSDAFLTNAVTLAKTFSTDGANAVYEVSKAFRNHVEDAVPYALEPGCPGCPSPDCVPAPSNPGACPANCCDNAITSDQAELADKDIFPLFDDVTNIRKLAPPLPTFIPKLVNSYYASYASLSMTPDPFPIGSPSTYLSFYSATDTDIFSFVGHAGIPFTFYLFGTGAKTCIKVLGCSTGSVLASSASCTDTSLTYSSLTFNPTSSDLYCLSAAPVTGSGVSLAESNTYSLMAYALSGDEYPDSRQTAVPIVADFFFGSTDPIPGRINDAADIDYFYVDLYGDSIVTFSLSSSSLANILLEDSSGNGLAIAWNDGNPVVSSALSVGRYYFRVAGTGTQNYSIRVSTLGAMAGSGTRNGAMSIVVNGAVQLPGPVTTVGTYRGVFTSATDSNYFKLNLQKGKIVQLFTHNLSAAAGTQPGVDTVLELFAPDSGFQNGGNVTDLILFRDDDGGVENDKTSRLQFVAPVTGNYVVRVRQPDAVHEPSKGSVGGVGHYMLSVAVGTADYSASFPKFPGE